MAMRLRLTDEQAEVLRRQAECEGVSVQDVAQRAISDLADALDRQAIRYQRLLERLGSV
jgi:uncharacterized protein (DUF1778 family)